MECMRCGSTKLLRKNMEFDTGDGGYCAPVAYDVYCTECATFVERYEYGCLRKFKANKKLHEERGKGI